jgi:hypothetical protein
MSVNSYKRRFKIGKVCEDKKVDYEAFHTLHAEEGDLYFEMKKRYVRLACRPIDAVIFMNVEETEAVIESLEGKMEKPPVGKGHYEKLKKDPSGFKVYGQFNDAHDIPIVVVEGSGSRVTIRWVAAGLPHLREVEVGSLVVALSRFVHEKKKAGKTCKECRSHKA